MTRLCIVIILFAEKIEIKWQLQWKLCFVCLWSYQMILYQLLIRRTRQLIAFWIEWSDCFKTRIDNNMVTDKYWIPHSLPCIHLSPIGNLFVDHPKTIRNLVLIGSLERIVSLINKAVSILFPFSKVASITSYSPTVDALKRPRLLRIWAKQKWIQDSPKPVWGTEG